jgi:putative NADH-flavin reductase
MGARMADQPVIRRIAVLGASGGIGRRVVAQALARGWAVSAQTRDGAKLGAFADRVRIVEGAPTDPDVLRRLLAGADAVVFALGVDRGGETTLFSETTHALLPAMSAEGVTRLVAVTGVGAGETRGHGGFLYDRIVFPLFTRKRYADKDRQEALIAASDTDWTIVRPAPFNDRRTGGDLQVVTDVRPETRLRRIARDEVADFLVDTLSSGAYRRQRPFIGHP